MEELYTEHEGDEVCPVCKMNVPNPTEALKFIDPSNQEAFFFDVEACYKQFMENPEQFASLKDEEGEEA